MRATVKRFQISELDKAVFKGTVLWGILAFGYMLTNKITSNDDLGSLYSTGGGIYNGRWMTGLYGQIFHAINSPWNNGIIFLIIAALTSVLILRMLQIKNRMCALLIGATFITFPSNISLLFYDFTVVPYALGIFLSVLAALLISKRKSIWSIQGGCICIVLSLAFYQAYFCLTASLLILVLIKEIRDISATSTIKYAMLDIAILAEGMAIYLMVQSLLVRISSVSTSYQNKHSIGEVHISDIPEQIVSAYNIFVKYNQRMFPFSVAGKIVDVCTIIITVLFLFIFMRNMIVEHTKLKIVLLVIASILLPIACNLVYMYGAEEVHSLMLYGNVCRPILCILLVDMLVDDSKFNIKFEIQKVMSCVVCIMILCMNINNAVLANHEYSKQEHLVNATTQYLNVLITQIKSLEGYNSDMKVAFVGLCNDPAIDEIDSCYLKSSLVGSNNMWQLINTPLHWGWCQTEFFRVYMGYTAEFVTSDEERQVIADNPIVQNMPNYPNAGSIGIVDDVIVVHLSN